MGHHRHRRGAQRRGPGHRVPAQSLGQAARPTVRHADHALGHAPRRQGPQLRESRQHAGRHRHHQPGRLHEGGFPARPGDPSLQEGRAGAGARCVQGPAGVPATVSRIRGRGSGVRCAAGGPGRGPSTGCGRSDDARPVHGDPGEGPLLQPGGVHRIRGRAHQASGAGDGEGGGCLDHPARRRRLDGAPPGRARGVAVRDRVLDGASHLARADRTSRLLQVPGIARRHPGRPTVRLAPHRDDGPPRHLHRTHRHPELAERPTRHGT